MKNPAASITPIGRMQQRLHRQELKLARLKTKLDKNRQADARLKLRLGGLLYLVGWENLPESDLDRAVQLVLDKITTADDVESLRIAGSNLLAKLKQEKSNDENSADLDEESRRELIHKKITKGGLMVKHGLQEFERATLLGALLAESGKNRRWLKTGSPEITN